MSNIYVGTGREFFEAMRRGEKTFYIDKSLDGRVGDTLIVKEIVEPNGPPTGRELSADVVHVSRYFEDFGCLVLGIKVLP